MHPLFTLSLSSMIFSKCMIKLGHCKSSWLKIKPLYSLVLVCCNINLASYIVNFTEVYLSLLFNMTMVSLVIVKRLLDFLIIFIRPAFEPI